jgi:heat shock protein HtpX
MLLAGLTMLLLFVGDAIAGPNGLVLGLFMAVAMNGVAYFFSDKIALMMSGAKPVTPAEAPRLYAVTQELCMRAGLPMPRLYIIPEAAPNAFATGRNPKNAAVAATAGLMEALDDEELRGVIAHELAHVRNRDILTASVAATLAGAITFASRIGIYGGHRDSDRGGLPPIFALLMLILAPIAALLVQLAISRQREFAADALAARMVGYPHGLIGALQKLENYNRRMPMHSNEAMNSLYIVAPFSAGGFTRLLSTHPPVQERIAALRNMALGR